MGWSRRQIVGIGIGAAAAALPVACSSGTADSHHSGDATLSVTDYGAVGDGKTDDTAAVAKAVSAAGPAVALHFPRGAYRLKSFPELPDFATITGVGADLSTLMYDGDDTFIALKGRQRVAFRQIGIFATGVRGTALRISGSFRCSFDGVTVRGNHTAATHPKYDEQHGIVLDENTGGTAFINCDINNFGVGLTTSCIQNYVTSSKFTNNRTSVLGAGSDHNAGLSMTNVEFVSDGDHRTTGTHVKVEGAANDWFMTNIWVEGCDIAFDIGGSTGGPAQFGIVNAKVAARNTAIILRSCRQPYLANVSIDDDTGTSHGPVPLQIDRANCPEGTAINLISGTEDDVASSLFPPDWHVLARHGQAGGTVLTPMIMNAPMIANSTANGPVLQDDSGNYWQLFVDDAGKLSTRSYQPPRT
jgi:hypothetical protein